jgi:ligand-binding sensor protein
MEKIMNKVKETVNGGLFKKVVIVGGAIVGLVVVGSLLLPRGDEYEEIELIEDISNDNSEKI